MRGRLSADQRRGAPKYASPRPLAPRPDASPPPRRRACSLQTAVERFNQVWTRPLGPAVKHPSATCRFNSLMPAIGTKTLGLLECSTQLGQRPEPRGPLSARGRARSVALRHCGTRHGAEAMEEERDGARAKTLVPVHCRQTQTSRQGFGRHLRVNVSVARRVAIIRGTHPVTAGNIGVVWRSGLSRARALGGPAASRGTWRRTCASTPSPSGDAQCRRWRSFCCQSSWPSRWW